MIGRAGHGGETGKPAWLGVIPTARREPCGCFADAQCRVARIGRLGVRGLAGAKTVGTYAVRRS